MSRDGEKTFVVLDEEAQMLLERIRIDQDPEEALEFVNEVVISQVGDSGHPCFEGYEKFIKNKG